MSKSFSDWIKERRTTIMLPSGIEAEVRLPSGFKLAQLGPLPQIESMEEGRSYEVARRYIISCLARLGEEKDPVGRGLMEPDDLPTEDIQMIVDTIVRLMPRGEESEDGVPLADTGCPDTPQES